jgi:uncharacterized protein YceH (UPF0502 family)
LSNGIRTFAGESTLSASEIRVLGCLLEKQRTTPEQYPLTLNGLRLACNQSTNRDPVLDYDDSVLREALSRLERRGLVRLASGPGSRAPKYRHLLADALPMGDGERALMCALMLRGPQTPGELKQRTERMHSFRDLASVGAALEGLRERGLVKSLGRRPGQKEDRFRELLGEDGAGDREPPPDSDVVAKFVPPDSEGSAAPPTADATAASTSATGLDTPPTVSGARADGDGVSAHAFAQLSERVERLEGKLARLLEQRRAADGGGA